MAGLLWVVGTIEILVMVVVFWNRPRHQGPLFGSGRHPLEYTAALIAAAATGFAWYQGWVTRDSEQRQLRGYAMVESSKIGLDPNGIPTVSITVKNFGQTPIYGFRHWSCAIIRDFPDRAQDFPPTSMITATKAPESLVAPNATIGKDYAGSCFPTEQSISPPVRAAIMAGTKAVFAVGVLKYKDAFGVDRETRYRRGWNGKEFGVDGYGGNCADDGCPKE
jgi:hypothetical protein